ncbi:MAG: hypothetical protein MHM6MM_006368, partial [Cercozoa sp. M6MM]
YRLVDNPEEMVIVGTTRIETMLGDVAVAVHPEDERYKHLHGKLLQHPFCDRQIPIITDAELVDMEFGTGCVKITPAHDHNDFECGKRHNLEQIDVLTDDGRINDNGGRFAGMMRFDARYKIIEALEAEGLFMGKEKNEMELPVCSRSGDVIEPRVKPQWYVDCADAAARAIDYVESGDLQISPDTGKRDFVHTWLGKIRPWCVSRQLWWGHRIPAWRVIVDGVRAEDDCDQTHWVIAHDEQEALKIASERFPGRELQLEQDPDVLDTWFSSGLLPFSSLGWPEQDSVDFQKYYPNTLLETGGDILFFWVARMVMMGIMLTEQLPFKQVFLHPLVRDKDGAKISKSKGNVIDPLHIINGVSLETLLSELENGNLPEKEVVKAQKAKKKEFPKGIPTCGADALRFGLLEFTTPTGRNVNLNINRVIGTRHFCNKIWNATRFSLRNFAEDFEPVAVEELDTSTLSVADKWILSRLAKCVETVNTAFETYHFAESTSAVYQFFTTELCDVYLELLKPVFTSGSPAAQLAAQQTLFLCLETSLLLMHPMMPFVTEELYHFLPKRAEAAPLMLETYPQSAQWASLVDDAAEASLALAQKVAGAARSTRESLNLDNKLRPQLFALCQSEEMATQLAPLTDSVSTLASASSLEVLTDESDERLRQCALSVVSSSLSLYTHVAGCGLNVAAEIKKVAKKQSKLQKICEKLEKKFQNAKYMEKAPEAQKLQDQAKLAEYQAQIAELGTSLRQLQRAPARHKDQLSGSIDRCGCHTSYAASRCTDDARQVYTHAGTCCRTCWVMPRVDDHGLVKFLLQRLMQHAQPFLDGTKPLDLDASAAAFLSDQFRAARLQDSKLPEKAREFDESAFVRLKSKTDLQGIQREEFEHLLPLLAAVSWLRVTGAREKKSSPLLDFAMFPNARVVQFMNIGVRGIRNIGTLKKRVQKLTVSTPLVSSPRMLLAKDYGRGKPDDSPWEALRVLALRGCNITELDDSLSLLPQLEFLDCSDNQMTRISETEKLEKLRYANFSRNRLQDMRKLRMHFGMLSTLVLRGNSISSVDGLDQMYSLQALDLGANRLASFDEIRLLARLPCLQSLWLDGNPLASVPNFRRRTLKLLLQFAPDFADRAEEFILDGKKIESVDMTPPPDESSWAVRAMSFLFGDDDASPRPSTGGETPVRSVNTAVDGARRPVRRQSARRKPRTVVIKSAGDVAQQERRRLRKPALPDASESESDSDYSDHSDRAEPVISRHAVRRVRDRTDSFVVPEPTPVSAQRTLESDDDKDGQTGGHTDGQTGDGQTGGYTEGQTGYTDGVTGDHDTEHVEYGLEYSTAALWPVARSRALLRPLRVLSREELRHTVPFSRAERAALAAATFLQNERGQASASRRLQVAVYLCPTDAFERDEQKQKLAATDQRSVRLQGDVIKEVHPRSGHILRRFRMQQ